MKKLTIKALSLSLGLSTFAYSQNKSVLNSVAQDISFNKNGKVEFLKIKRGLSIFESNTEGFVNSTFLNDLFKISKLKSETDELGYTHQRFSITYNNVPVCNEQIVTHSKDGKIVSLNGHLSAYNEPVNSVVLNESKALEKALQKVNAQKYMWENEAQTAQMRKSFNNSQFTFYPKAELVLFVNAQEELRYAYKFDIYAELPLYRANVFVDAQTGNILSEENLIHTADVPATANTRFSGVKTMTVDNVSPGLYRLQETGRGLGVETYNLNTSQTFSAAVDYTNTTTSWTTTTIQQVGTDAHWGAEMVYDYYLTQHSRNSIDNAGHKLISYADYGVGYQNAFWNGFWMTYGSGGGGGFTGLDICGHEVTHGLTSKTSALVYQNESGALNESYSDIFGVAIEHFAKPSSANWLMGEDVGVIRSMSNPNAYGDPDTYQGLNWYTGTGDNGGVHTNSGVSNFWYYLLCQGGTGVNDISNSYTVTSIGMTAASRIAFRALTVYYGPNTNYSQARTLSIQAATDLYGACSNEVYQVKSAWYAVGVGPAPSGTMAPTANFTSFAGSICSLPVTVNFVNKTMGGDNYFWDFGDGSTISTSFNPTHTYTTNGVYTVKLKSTSNCSSSPDSIIKTSYITINAPSAPTITSSAPICTGTSATLNASGSGQQYWYNVPNTTATPLFIGNAFVTPSLTSNSTFYVANTFTNASVYGAPTSTAIGTGAFFPGTTAYDSLSVLQPCTLKSVVVYASTAANRVFELRNSTNAVLSTTTIPLTAGANTVNLNFKLNPGYGYRLGLGAGTAQLYRNSGGVSYPYNIGGLVEITGSSGGAGQFFFFYNWEVQQDNCTSLTNSVTVTVNQLPNVSASATSTQVCTDDGALALVGSPAGGTFSGSGVIGTNFNPSVGAGSYTVNYVYTDGNGCSNTGNLNIVVSPCIGVNEISGLQDLTIFPNPFNDLIHVNGLNNLVNAKILLTDATGKQVLVKEVNGIDEVISVNKLSAGVYLLEIKDDLGHHYRSKLIKQ